MRKGQVSLEYMIIVGILFLMIIPLLFLYTSTQQDTTDTLTEGQLRKAGTVLRDAAERVYYAGEPAQEVIEIYFPEHIKAIVLSNSSIAFTANSGSGNYDLVINSAAPLNGTIGIFHGVHIITVRAENGTVQVSE
jgi:uncharacterized protein (UPF0333 family)